MEREALIYANPYAFYSIIYLAIFIVIFVVRVQMDRVERYGVHFFYSLLWPYSLFWDFMIYTPKFYKWVIKNGLQPIKKAFQDYVKYQESK